jgi:hypothetical protein
MNKLFAKLISKVLGQPFPEMYSDAYIFGLLPKEVVPAVVEKLAAR